MAEYCSYEVMCLRAFFEQSDPEGAKNGDKLCSSYAIEDPGTWCGVTWGASEDGDDVLYVCGILWESDELVGLLDVCNFQHLVDLQIPGNKITCVKVEKCYNLENFNCEQNLLTSLDLRDQSNLKDLNCSKNQLKDVSLSNCKSLELLDVTDNQLATLNMHNNTALKEVYCTGNLFKCVNVANKPQLKKLFIS